MAEFEPDVEGKCLSRKCGQLHSTEKTTIFELFGLWQALTPALSFILFLLSPSFIRFIHTLHFSHSVKTHTRGDPLCQLPR